MAALENKGVSRRDFLTRNGGFGRRFGCGDAIPCGTSKAGYRYWAADDAQSRCRSSLKTRTRARPWHISRARCSCISCETMPRLEPRKVPDAWDYGMRRRGRGRGRRQFERCSACELTTSVICVESMASWGGNAQSAGMCGHSGRLFEAGRKALRIPELSVRPQSAHRLGDGRIPLRGRPEAHL